MRVFRVVFFIAVLIGSISVLAQGPRRDGKWEVTMEMEMPGMPMRMPPTTTTQCITPEQAKDPQRSMPTTGRDNNPNDCKVSDYKTEGNKVSWSMRCEGREPMTGTGEITYAGESYKGKMQVNMRGMMMTMNYSGKRLGDCPAPSR